MEEDKITDELLVSTVRSVYENRKSYVAKMDESNQDNGVDLVLDLIQTLAEK